MTVSCLIRWLWASTSTAGCSLTVRAGDPVALERRWIGGSGSPVRRSRTTVRLSGRAGMSDETQALPEREVRVLGAFDVLARGRSVAPPGAKRRALLAVLALRANEVVPVDRLVDRIWGENPPHSAVNLIHTYVSLWRRILDEALGPGEGRRRLVRVGSGYRLVLAPGELDLEECRRLVNVAQLAGGRARWDEAFDRLSRALAAWNPEVLADLRGEPVHSGLHPLEEERRAVLQTWGEAGLAAHRGASIIGVLQEALDRDPLQEQVAVLLVRALHSEGRPAEALMVFDRTRRALSDELGTSPGQRLADAHLLVLRQEEEPHAAAKPRPVRVLPLWNDVFVGREAESAELRELVRRHRLVTVTGPGGSGKTRLAVQVAAAVAVDMPQLAPCFVDASVLADASQFSMRVAAALGIDLISDQTA